MERVNPQTIINYFYVGFSVIFSYIIYLLGLELKAAFTKTNGLIPSPGELFWFLQILYYQKKNMAILIIITTASQ